MKTALIVAALLVIGAPSFAQVFDPSPTDARIVAAMAARKRMEMPKDLKEMEELFAPDLIVNSPINKAVTRANVLERMRSGAIAYEPENAEVIMELVAARDNSVVMMGEEVLTPTGNAPFAGKRIRRRFTDVWKPVNGKWMLAIRQATIFSVQ
jgi:hypothetical protein